MQDKNPFSYPMLTYAWVLGLAATGGLIAALKKEQSAKKTIVDVMASAFAGLLTFWFCEANAINPLYSAIFIAVNGHLGTKALTRIYDFFGERFMPTGSRVHKDTEPPAKVPTRPKRKALPKPIEDSE